MKKVVTVGGGTGSYVILSGLKHLENISISALVSMADSGGSTGMLRDELGVMATGDIRKCLTALAEPEQKNIMRELMNYRFSEGKLSGHNFGNIFLAALEKVIGDFAEGVVIASKILNIRGIVIPITKDNAELSMSFSNGTKMDGEMTIDRANLQDLQIDKISYKDKVELNEDAKKAMLEADYIIFGPGDYYTSILPNVVVDGFTEALGESKAKIILPINLINKKGHTTHWKVSDYVKVIESFLKKPVDFVLVNNEKPSKEQMERYSLTEGNGALVVDDLKDNRVVRDSLLSHVYFPNDKADILEDARSFIRHDAKKLAECIKKIINQ